MNVGIANDHRGLKLKQKLTNYLEKKGYNVIDFGTDTIDSVDYPDYAFKLCDSINEENIDLGIAICGTGIGMSIACNKVKGIRCAKVSNSKEAILARKHNNANIIALSSDTSIMETKDIIDEFLNTNFSEDERHINRIKKMTDYEDKK